MRDILFRGKRKDNGEWTYGYVDATMYKDTWVIHTDNATHEADSDTIGQYTGLEDKNGVRIYIGDVVRYTTNNRDFIGVVGWDRVNPSICIYYKVNSTFEVTEYDFVVCGLASVEILGNIYDNPELIEKGGDE